MTESNNNKGVSHASCKAKGDCNACGGCCKDKMGMILDVAMTRLVEVGIPETVAELCVWLSEPMFRHEYPDADVRYMITDPDSAYDLAFERDLGFGYDIWIGMGYESEHSDSACKMHFDVDPNTRELTWCNVSEWAVDDDRWRGACRFYDKDRDSMTLNQLYDEIDKYFAS